LHEIGILLSQIVDNAQQRTLTEGNFTIVSVGGNLSSQNVLDVAANLLAEFVNLGLGLVGIETLSTRHWMLQHLLVVALEADEELVSCGEVSTNDGSEFFFAETIDGSLFVEKEGHGLVVD
jgi:hypothetical protein